MNLNFSDIPKFIINLQRNVDRKSHMIEELKKFSVSKWTFFDAIDKNDLIVPEISPKINESNAAGILGCAMSHIKVVEEAKRNNYPVICVFEDDIIFCKDFQDKIKYIEQLLDFDFDILCLGGHFSNKEISGQEAERTQWENIHRIKKMNGTYGLIFTKKTYDFILRNWNFSMGADEFYSNHVYSRFKTFAHVPFLVGCGKNKSDVTGMEWEYESISWHFDNPNKYTESRWLKTKIDEPITLNANDFADLQDCTFIIPVKIESEDRAFNFVRCIQHLCNTTKTNIIIKECSNFSAVLDLLNRIDKKFCTINHIYEWSDGAAFHRTRHLNEMLSLSKTPVTINYDIDCLLKKETYIEARKKIIDEEYDLIYPYGRNEDQIQITFENKQDYKTDLFDSKFHAKWGSLCGHVQFFKTKSYKSGFAENENFVSYAPEDRERMDRFIKLGYKVEWLPGHKCFHIEHSRGVNSSVANPHYGEGEALYNKLHNMSKEDLICYYKNQEYISKF